MGYALVKLKADEPVEYLLLCITGQNIQDRTRFVQLGDVGVTVRFSAEKSLAEFLCDLHPETTFDLFHLPRNVLDLANLRVPKAAAEQ